MTEFESLLLQQMTRIADALESLATLQAPEPLELQETCQHPLESRQDFGTTQGQPDWLCGVCQYRSVVDLSPLATTIPDPQP